VIDQSASSPNFNASLNARAGGLAVKIELPHIANACREEIVIPVATLRAERTSEATLRAIAAAH
jgi:hypothetical protein